MRPNILLLQGPIGPFFSRFAEDLEARGFNVFKINFNGGDRFFFPSENAIDYTGKLDQWEAWLERLIINRQISRVYLFGDCRSYHRIAREVIKRHSVRLFVFEEGYIRPNFITLEEHGVNGHSPMMQNPVTLTDPGVPLPEEIAQPGHVFAVTALYSMLYYWASAWRRRRFANYRHHRPFEWLPEGMRWIRSGLRKLRYARRERGVLDELLPQFDGNYFVCPLQVHCDMQVVVHSEFNSIEHFIGEVLISFNESAPINKAIVFKHHPLDRGYTDYTSLFANLVAELGLQGRVFYVHDTCLPTLLRHAQGTVLINSTVGVSSLFHGTPVRTMGKAIYDLPGLTEQCALEDFWHVDHRVDSKVFGNFRSHLVLRNQLNGNLYRRLGKRKASGIEWSRPLAEAHTYLPSRVGPSIPPQLTLINGGAANDGIRRRDDDDDNGAEAA